MRVGRFVLATVVLFVVAMLWNGVLHTVVLREANASVAHLRRPDLQETMPLAMLLTAGLVALFVLGYGRAARSGSLPEALGYALFFAALAGLLVDLNQFVQYPLPASVAALWFAGGVGEFLLYAVLTRWLYPARGRVADAELGAAPDRGRM